MGDMATRKLTPKVLMRVVKQSYAIQEEVITLIRVGKVMPIQEEGQVVMPSATPTIILIIRPTTLKDSRTETRVRIDQNILV